VVKEQFFAIIPRDVVPGTDWREAREGKRRPSIDVTAMQSAACRNYQEVGVRKMNARFTCIIL